MRSRNRATISILAFLCLTPALTRAQQPRAVLAADLDTRAASNLLETRIISINGRNLTAMSDGAHGEELWSFGANGQSPQLVRDIAPGGTSSAPEFLANLGGRAYFTALSNAHGRELWSTDGTRAGTRLAVEIRKGSADSGIYGAVVFKNELYFVADDGMHGRELWAWDGTKARMVIDLLPGKGSAFWGRSVDLPRPLIVAHGRLWFEARENENGTGFEVYVSDGSAAGTKMAADLGRRFYNRINILRPGANGRVLIGVQGGGASFSTALYASDGSKQGTQLLFNDVTGHATTSFGSRLLVMRLAAQSRTSTWITDGTTSQQVPDSLRRMQPSLTIGNRFLYTGTGGVWVTDGRASGTRLAVPSSSLLGSVRGLALIQTSKSVISFDPVRGTQVQLPVDKAKFFGEGVANIAWLRDTNNVHWTTDGSASGTRQIARIPNVRTMSSTPRSVAAYGNTSLIGTRIGQTNNIHTLDRSKRAQRIGPWAHDDRAAIEPALYRGRFWANDVDSVRGVELASFDVRTLRRLSIYDNTPGASTWPVVRMIPAGRLLYYFQTAPGRLGYDLYATNGDTRANRLVFPASFASFRNAESWGENLIFSTGSSLYLSNGAQETQIWSGGINLKPLANRGRDFIFAGHDQARTSVFVLLSDGSRAGTRVLYSVPRLPRAGGTQDTAIALDDTYIIGHGDTLYATRGNAASTKVILDKVSNIGQLVRMKRGLAAFVADTSSARSIFVTDGTKAGTRSIRDWPRNARITKLSAHGGRWLSFVIDDNAIGLSDAARVQQIINKVRAPLVAQQGDRLVFFAEDPTRGAEPHFLIGLGAMFQVVGEGCGRGTRMMQLDSTPPNVGAAAELDVRHGPGNAVALLGIGAPTLRSIAAPDGCMLHFDAVAPIAVTPFALRAGAARFAVKLPNDPKLRGLSIALQVASFGAQGFETSNGLIWYLD